MAVMTTTPKTVERYDAIRANSAFIFVVCTLPRPLVTLLPNLPQATPDLHGTYRRSRRPCPHRNRRIESKLPKMREATGYDGETIVDTENLLVDDLGGRGIIDVAISGKKGYPRGMTQPAMNLRGAKDRPSLKEMWEHVEAEVQGEEPVHAQIPLLSFLQGIRQKIFG
ncbi:MAG: hypothetical protein Q9170_004399 [Blastenia crenularia]